MSYTLNSLWKLTLRLLQEWKSSSHSYYSLKLPEVQSKEETHQNISKEMFLFVPIVSPFKQPVWLLSEEQGK